jgi:hypothetical protein
MNSYRISIADKMREEHRRRVLGESDRPGRREAASFGQEIGLP